MTPLKFFRYHALDLKGRKHKNVLCGHSSFEIETLLEKAHLVPLRVRETQRTPFSSAKSLLPQFFSLFSMFLKSGLSLQEALKALRDHFSQTSLLLVLETILVDLEEGKSLHKALERHRLLFGPLAVPLLRIGEKTGALPDILAHLSLSFGQLADLKAKTRTALRYPLVALSCVSLLLFVLFLHVIPALEGLLLQSRQEVAWTTRLLFFVSRHAGFLFWFIGSLLGISFCFLFFLYKNSTVFKARVHRVLLEIPLLGPFLRLQLSIHLTAALALMLTYKVPLWEALEELLHLSPNLRIQEILGEIKSRVHEGLPLSQAFETSGFFPSHTLRLMKAGEKAGTLSKMLDAAVRLLEKEQDENLKRATALIEPTLIGITGLVLAWVAFSVFLPIYDQLGRLDG